MDSHDKRIVSLASVAIGIILIGTVFYHNVEGWRYLDAFYFSATTLTTVGFGDLYPTQDISKIFTVAYIFFGVGIIFYSLGVFGRHYIEEHQPDIEKAIMDRLSKADRLRKHIKRHIIGRFGSNNAKKRKDVKNEEEEKEIDG